MLSIEEIDLFKRELEKLRFEYSEMKGIGKNILLWEIEELNRIIYESMKDKKKTG